jgi:uncharacterized protein YjbI with pentapeptide repeats
MSELSSQRYQSAAAKPRGGAEPVSNKHFISTTSSACVILNLDFRSGRNSNYLLAALRYAKENRLQDGHPIVFVECNFEGVDFPKALNRAGLKSIENIQFVKSNLNHASFNKASLQHIDIFESSIYGTDFRNASVKDLSIDLLGVGNFFHSLMPLPKTNFSTAKNVTVVGSKGSKLLDPFRGNPGVSITEE